MARPKVSDLLAQEEAGMQQGAPAQASARPKVSDLAAKEDSDPGFWSKVGDAAIKYGLPPIAFVGDQIDRVTTAPARAAIGEVQANREARGGRAEGLGKFLDPQEYTDIGRFGLGYLKNFGRDPEKAPTPSAVMESYGVPKTALSDVAPSLYSESGDGWALKKGGLLDPTASGTAGMIAEMAAPIPGLGVVKSVVAPTMNMAGKVAEGTAKVAAKAADIATGTKAASKTLGAIEGGMNNLGEALKSRFGTELAPDANKHIQTMIDNGIDPEKANAAVLFGPNSSASHLERARAETPIGETLRKNHEAFTNEIQGAIRKEIERIGGVTKESAISNIKIPKTTQEAGELITTAYNNRVDEILNKSQDTYKSLSGRAPGAKIPPTSMQKLNSKLDELAKHATDMGVDSFDDVTESQAKHLLGVVDKIKRSQGDLAATVRGLSGLGKTAFKTKYPLGAIPPDIAKLRELYGDIAESVVDGVKANFGPEVAQSLRENNKAISEMFKDSKLIPSLGDEAKSADRVFENLILNGDSKTINTVKKYLTPEELQQTKAAFLDILNKKNIQGDITFRNRLSQNLSDPKKSINALFDEGELENLKSLFELGDRAGKSVLSSSGTGGSMAHQAASLGDIVRPGKWLDKAEEGADKFAAGRQKKAASRAIGFELEKQPNRAAAKNPNRPPTMGFNSVRQAYDDLQSFNPRMRTARSFSSLQEEENK
jgi:hypothetical protein